MREMNAIGRKIDFNPPNSLYFKFTKLVRDIERAKSDNNFDSYHLRLTEEYFLLNFTDIYRDAFRYKIHILKVNEIIIKFLNLMGVVNIIFDGTYHENKDYLLFLNHHRMILTTYEDPTDGYMATTFNILNIYNIMSIPEYLDIDELFFTKFYRNFLNEYSEGFSIEEDIIIDNYNSETDDNLL